MVPHPKQRVSVAGRLSCVMPGTCIYLQHTNTVGHACVPLVYGSTWHLGQFASCRLGLGNPAAAAHPGVKLACCSLHQTQHISASHSHTSGHMYSHHEWHCVLQICSHWCESKSSVAASLALHAICFSIGSKVRGIRILSCTAKVTASNAHRPSILGQSSI